MNRTDKLLSEATSLIAGLERISADSIWAHRSSGYRGAMLRVLERLEKDPSSQDRETDLAYLRELLKVGYRMLVSAAREIGK